LFRCHSIYVVFIIIIIIYLPRTHTTHNVNEKQIAYSRYDEAEIQH